MEVMLLGSIEYVCLTEYSSTYLDIEGSSNTSISIFFHYPCRRTILLAHSAMFIFDFTLLPSPVPVSGADFMTSFSGVELADPLRPSAVLLRRITLPTLWSPLLIPISSWPNDFFLLNGTKLVPVPEVSLLGALDMDR